MHGCNVTSGTINGDKNNRISKAIANKCSTDDARRLTYLALANDENFVKEVYDYAVANNIKFQAKVERDNLNRDTVTINDLYIDSVFHVLNEKFKESNKSVLNTVVKKDSDNLAGFSSIRAKREAIDHSANQVIEVYYDNISKTKENKLNNKEILESIQKRFIDRVEKRIFKEVKDRVKENNPNNLNNINEIENQYNEAANKFNELNKKYKVLKQQYKTNKNESVGKQILQQEKELKELKKQFLEIKQIKSAAIYNFINEYGNEREKNYNNLADIVKQNPNHWFKEVFKHSKLVDLVNQFNTVLEEDRLRNLNEQDELDLENDDSELDDVDQMSKGWEDTIPASFDRMFNVQLKLYLSTLYKMDKPGELGSEDYSYDTNNTLGVPQTMGTNFVITQILNYADFSSVNAFIKSLNKASKSIESIYGLSKLVNDMANNPIFANFVFQQLGDPKVRKTIANITETGLEFTQSNRTSDPIGYTIFEMFNSVKNTYQSQFAEDDIDNLNKLNNIPKIKLTNTSPIVLQATNIIKNYLYKYFPKLDENTINAMIFNGDIYENIKNINNLLHEFQSAIADITETYNRNLLDYNKKLAAYHQLRNAAMETGEPFLGERPIFDNNNESFDKIYKSLIPLAKKISQYAVTKNELNTTNAEGNLASDIIKNNYIANLFKQIQYGNEESANKGLEQLKEFVTRGKQYDNSPIFFGVRDANNKLIVPGLFIRNVDGSVVINPNAKNIISFALFDGAKDRTSNNAVMYSGMTKGDYFLTSILTFTQPIKSGEQLGIATNKFNEQYAGFFMRTPSDAPKNFIIQAPKYSINGLNGLIPLFANNKESEVNYFNTQSGKILSLYNKELDVVGSSKKLAKNYYSKEDFYDLLSAYINGEELDNINYNSLQVIEDEETNTVEIPIIYKLNNGDKIVLYITGNRVQGEVNKILENVKIEGIAAEKTKIVNDFTNEIRDIIIEEGVNNGQIEQIVDSNNTIFRGFYTHLYNEFTTFIDQLNNVFERNDKGEWVTKDNITNLIDRAHYNGNSVVEEVEVNGKKQLRLSGNFFKFAKLFNSGNVDVNARLDSDLSLYGGANAFFNVKNGKLVLNLNRDFITENKLTSGTRLEFVKSREIDNIFNSIVSDWINAYKLEINERTKQYKSVIGDSFTNTQIQEALFNAAIMEMNFDDIFEGDSKFYKNAQDFLKRAKEVQAGGKAYASYDLNDTLGSELHNMLDINGNEQIIDIGGRQWMLPRRGTDGKYHGQAMKARNGFRAVTIKNTINSIQNAANIKEELLEIYEKKGYDKETAERIATEIAAGYFNNEKLNDAQSYITIDEFIARKFADGTLSEYTDILTQLIDVREGKKDIKDLDLENIQARIQVQKNFYYDIQWDENTKTYYPRQIKNAEFVIIPELVKGTSLEQLYNIMRSHDIGQLNTVETSKAAKKNICEYWDKNGEAHPVDFIKQIETNNETAIENYYYRYLYKQQDVPEHMKDAKNKAGIQIIKKLIDNADEETSKYIEDFFDTYVANIRDDFNVLLNNMGWKLINGKLVNADPNRKDDVLNFNEFYDKALLEAQRLGLDSNILDYLEPDELGNPIMPNYINLKNAKLESIAQAIFNSAITRQTLPGWHAAQVTAIGHGVDVLLADGTRRREPLKYHPATYTKDGVTITDLEYNKLSDEDKKDWTSNRNSYMEILVPRWSKLIPKEYSVEELAKEGLDLHIGYRIPTEGKQSVSIVKVVGFLDDVYGSTVMVPDAWVTQTGSDFDVDSVYAISYKMYMGRDNKLHKITYDNNTDYEHTQTRYINYINRLLKKRVEKGSAIDSDTYRKLKDAKDSIKAEQINKQKSILAEQTARSAEIWNNIKKDISKDFRQQIFNITQNKKDPKTFSDIYDTLATVTQNYLDTLEDGELKTNLREFVDVNLNIAEITQLSDEIIAEREAEFLERYKDEKSAIYKQAYLEAKQEYFERVSKIASDNNLVSFDEFATWNVINQNSRDARNNRMLDCMINIMQSENSREENYSRSNFDDLTEAMKHCNNLRGATKLNRSPYNPLDQIDFMENAMSGAKLKAFSVTRDTFCSVNNHVKTYLGKGHEIPVMYNAKQYDVNNAINAYGDDVIMYNNNNEVVMQSEECTKFTINHRRFANSATNRNVVGKLITPYSSQTTAHILDAIKEGAIYNENDYTFASFKTLIDVGIDYNTAIAFLQQPGITEIVTANNETNSIYSGASNNPIRTAIKRVANKIGIMVNGNPINDFTAMNSILNELNNAPHIQEAFKDLFNVDVSDVKSFMDIVFTLDRESLEKRLAEQPLTNDESKVNLYNLVYDLAMISTFNKLYKTSDNIGNLARCSNPDRFGAKQTVRSTRQVLNDIAIYSRINDIETEDEDGEVEIKPTHPAATTLMVDDETNLLMALYPGYLDGNIDVNASRYKYLAAFLKYSTIPSVEANSQLFVTENDKYVAILNSVQNKLGIKFTDEQYKEYKQYMMNDVYNLCHTLLLPHTISKQGYMVLDKERYANQDITDQEIMNLERERIFGYEPTQSTEFEIEDINNPTAEEKAKFERLTPAQKVIFLQYNLKDNAGIFDLLNVNMFNQYEYKNKGYSSESIKFNDSIEDMEEVYQMFLDAFHNTNDLIRSAAIDLVKYGFIAEGFRFKKGSISKIIPNKAIYESTGQFGTGLLDEIDYIFHNLTNPEDVQQDNFIDKFIRSHSDMVRLVRLPRMSKQGKDHNIADMFNKCYSGKAGGLTRIPFNEAYQDLLESIGVTDATSPRDYIKIERKLNNNTRRTYLFKIRKLEDAVYLIPMNTLDRAEVTDISMNKNNNKHPELQFYNQLIDDIENSESNFISYVLDNEKVIQKNKDLFTIKAKKRNVLIATKDNINALENIRKRLDGNQKQKDAIDKFIQKVHSQIFDELINTKGRTYDNVMLNEPSFTYLIPKEGIVQNIEINGVLTPIMIRRVKPSSQFVHRLRNELGFTNVTDNRKLKEYEINAFNDALIAHSVNPTLFKVSLVTDEQIKKATEELEEETEKEVAEEMMSITSTIQTVHIAGDVQMDKTDKVAKAILKEINKRGHALNEEERDNAAERAIKRFKANNINNHSSQSIKENRTNIFNIAAEYFEMKASNILYDLEHFEIDDYEHLDDEGQPTKISVPLNDSRVYKYLRNNLEEYHNIVKTILEAKTFGDVFYDIMNIDSQSEDVETSRAIEKIRKTLNDVRNSAILNGAVELLFNDFIANEYSTNPLVREGFIDLRTQFGDTNWFDLHFADISELDHKQIQTVVKMVDSIISQAVQLEAPRKAKEFTTKFDVIMESAGSFNWDNIVTKEGKFVSPYTDNFKRDMQMHLDKVKQLYNQNPNSLEYYKAKLEKDEWFAKNVNQILSPTYYNTINKLTRDILDKCPNEYIEYMRLLKELYNGSVNPDENTETINQRRKRIKFQIAVLTSEYDANMEEKSDVAKHKAKLLKEFIKNKSALNNFYFKYDERAGFKETLDRHLKYLKKFDNKNPELTLEEKLGDARYKDAYDWINNNTTYDLGLDENDKNLLRHALLILSKDSLNSNKNDKIKQIINSKDAYDEFGHIDPTKLNDEDILKIRNILINKNTNSYTYGEPLNGESALLKLTKKRSPIMSNEFYSLLRDDSEKERTVNAERLKHIANINKILYKCTDINGSMRFDKMIELSDEDKQYLINAYSALHKIKGNRDAQAIAKKLAAHTKQVVDRDAFNEAFNMLLLKFGNDENNVHFKKMLEIICQHKKDGSLRINKNAKGSKKYYPNPDLFGYTTNKTNRFVNKEKTEARDFIQNNFEQVPTEKYWEASKKASEENRFDEWFAMNHIYNNSTHRWEPLSIWTEMQVKPNSDVYTRANPQYIANFENRDRFIKNDKEDGFSEEDKKHIKEFYNTLGYNSSEYDFNIRNKNYIPGGDNYKADTGTAYNNNINLSQKEQDMLDLLKETMRTYANTYGMKKFMEKGFLPRRAKYKPDAKWYVKQAIGAMGLEFRNTGERRWSEKLDYANDVDADFDMMNLIKTKGYKERKEIRTQGTIESDEDYARYLENVRKENEQIDADNLKLDNEVLDRDWRSVFDDFIRKAVEYQARQRVKNTIYLTLEDLKTNPTYRENRITGNVVKNKKLSTDKNDVYETTEQRNAYKLFQNWARRVMFNQFKMNTKFSKWADLMQNVTSAKYMIFNVTGGVANIGTGLTNIFNEVFAKEYFDGTTFRKAQSQYFSSIKNMLADAYKEETDDLNVAIIKLFDVVDLDAFNERRPNETITKNIRRVRDGLYAMQSMGEHYMQNTVLFAMLKSNRKFLDCDGTVRWGSFNEYIWKTERQVMLNLLHEEGNQEYLNKYITYLHKYKEDINELRKIDRLSKNINEDFLRSTKDKEFMKKYIKLRNEAVEKAKKEFNDDVAHPTVESQLELKNGRADIKAGSEFTDRDFAYMRKKVIQVNKKIHGVYDKIGAAKIESEWWGGLAMQYHKHIYPGIMKRYRMKGYYNEARNTYEIGSYVTFAKYLSTEFRHMNDKYEDSEDNQERVALDSIKQIAKAIINTGLNFKLNYQLMSEFERRNIRRVLGDLLGISSSILAAMCIYCMTDDDDLKESEFLATALYITDRLLSEAQMYSPWGLVTESKTLWSSPIAAQNGPKDLFKAMGYTLDWMFNEDFDPNYNTGLYKGQNKFAVLAYRNTPIYRIYNRLSNMTSNNSYYRLDDTALNMRLAKSMADLVVPD